MDERTEKVITGLEHTAELLIDGKCALVGYTLDAIAELQRLSALVDAAPQIEISVASAIAHRACCGTEHDPLQGKLHGYCVVCGVPWPCETATQFLKVTRNENPK